MVAAALAVMDLVQPYPWPSFAQLPGILTAQPMNLASHSPSHPPCSPLAAARGRAPRCSPGCRPAGAACRSAAGRAGTGTPGRRRGEGREEQYGELYHNRSKLKCSGDGLAVACCGWLEQGCAATTAPQRAHHVPRLCAQPPLGRLQRAPQRLQLQSRGCDQD